jgi:hypothetical protein
MASTSNLSRDIHHRKMVSQRERTEPSWNGAQYVDNQTFIK